MKKFSALFLFEWGFTSRRWMLPVFAFLYLGVGLMLALGAQSPEDLPFNGWYQITFFSSLLTLLLPFPISFIAAYTSLRDVRSSTESLIFTSPISKRDFYWSRFLGLWTMVSSISILWMLTYESGLQVLAYDRVQIQSLDIDIYLWNCAVFIIPNTFIICSIVFSVAMLSRKSLVTYIVGASLYLVYFIAAIYSNSPMMAHSITPSSEAMQLAAILDPYGISAFFEQTLLWTTEQKTVQKITLSSTILLNRVFWVGLALGLLFMVKSFIVMRPGSEKGKKEKLTTSQRETNLYFPAKTHHSLLARFLQFWSILKLEWAAIFRNYSFWGILIAMMFASFLEMTGIISGGGRYGEKLYPYTHILLDICLEMMPFFIVVLLVFFSGITFRREEEVGMEPLSQTVPTPMSIRFTGKFLALAFIPIFLFLGLTLLCAGIQLSLGFQKIDMGLYGIMLALYTVRSLMYLGVCIVVQMLCRNKWLAMGLAFMVVLLFSTSLAPRIGIHHPLMRLASFPIPTYTDLAGFLPTWSSTLLHGLYWLNFTAILLVGSWWVYLRRHQKTSFNHLSISVWVIVGGSLLVFMGSGAVVLQNIDQAGVVFRPENRWDLAADYEVKYKQYEDFPRFHYVTIENEIALYPREGKVDIQADYLLINQNEKAIDSLFITSRIPLKNIEIERARMDFYDSLHHTYLWIFNHPILPGKKVRLTYKMTVQRDDYNHNQQLPENGIYLRHDYFEPALGYRSSQELKDKNERVERGLPPRLQEELEDVHLTGTKTQYRKVYYSATVSTDNDQMVIASGTPVKQWQKQGRKYYAYHYEEPSIPLPVYLSADYQRYSFEHDSTQINLYHHSGHSHNLAELEKVVTETLDYGREYFGDYPFTTLNIAEIPGYWGFGGSAHPGMIAMVEDHLYLVDIRKEKTFNLVARRTIHEVAHQWWGLQVAAKNIPGGSTIVEGFTKYMEAMVMRKMYGIGSWWQLNKSAQQTYFQGRTQMSGKEKTMMHAENAAYLDYGKSMLVLESIADLIGEEEMNQIMAEFFQAHNHPEQFSAHMEDFKERLFEKVPIPYQDLIDSWLSEVYLYELEIESADLEPLPDGRFKISCTVIAGKYDYADGEVVLEEPIRLGVFDRHPSRLTSKNDPLYYEFKKVKSGKNQFIIILDNLPKYVGIDPYFHRVDLDRDNNLWEF